jgi:hypothetical protein
MWSEAAVCPEIPPAPAAMIANEEVAIVCLYLILTRAIPRVFQFDTLFRTE